MKRIIKIIGIIVVLAGLRVSAANLTTLPDPNAPPGISKQKANVNKEPRYGAIKMPTWNPDGGKIAFVYNMGGNAEIFMVNADGTKIKNVSQNAGEDTNPVWSPDGKTLLFSSFRKGKFNLCHTDREGTKVDCIVGASDMLWPAWSPDGKTIAFCNYEKGFPAVYFMDPDGKNQRQYFEKPACYPAFSADGKRLALSSEGDIIVITLKNGKSKNITEPLIEGNMVDDTFPVWAPRGDRLAFIGAFESYSSEVYTISSGGKKVRRLTDNLYEDFLPNWDPKGKGVLYSGFVSGRPPELFISETEGPIRKQLTNDHILQMSPRFSPDGKSILYIVRRRAQDELYIMNSDGSKPRPFLKDKLPAIEQLRRPR